MTNPRPRRSQLTFEGRHTASFQEYVNALDDLYAQVDATRPVSDIALNLVLHSSQVSEAVRRSQHDQVASRLADVVVWLMGLAARLQGLGRNPEVPQRFRTALDVIQSLDRAVWSKYPGYCPVCLGRLFTELGQAQGIGAFDETTAEQRSDLVTEVHRRIETRRLSSKKPENPILNCECLTTPGTENREKSWEEDKKKWRRHFAATYESEMPKSISEWERLYECLFGLNAEKSTLDAVAFHLAEEVGEVAECLTRLYTYDQLEPASKVVEGEPSQEALSERTLELSEEIADALSWTFSLMFKIKEPFRAVDEYTKAISRELDNIENVVAHLTVADLVWDIYGHTERGGRLRCPICKEPRCERHMVIVDSMVNAMLARST